MAGSEITGKLFTKIVRGLPSGFSLSDISQVFGLDDILGIPQPIKGWGQSDQG